MARLLKTSLPGRRKSSEASKAKTFVLAVVLVVILVALVNSQQNDDGERLLSELTFVGQEHDQPQRLHPAPSQLLQLTAKKNEQQHQLSTLLSSQSPPVQPAQSSKHATVMGMATGYGPTEYKRFVGSLRRSGFQGTIILVISTNPAPGVESYLKSQNVITKRLTTVNCTNNIQYEANAKLTSHDVEVMTCAHPYPDLKVRWGRFALLRDHLEECQECTGPVLVTDVRDTYFQRDPFGPEAPPVPKGQLQVFREHRKMRTTHWLVQRPVARCKQPHATDTVVFDEPMLCSGTTIGARDAMLQYLEDMVAEMRVWMKDPNCCCNKMSGDDQSIHNYLYYSGKLPYAVPQDNRVGLVNTVGSQGAMIFKDKRVRNMELGGMDQRAASIRPYNINEEELKQGDWLGLQYDLTDKEGFFIDFNGERSFIVHQYDRFGLPFSNWLDNYSGLKDP